MDVQSVQRGKERVRMRRKERENRAVHTVAVRKRNKKHTGMRNDQNRVYLTMPHDYSVSISVG